MSTPSRPTVVVSASRGGAGMGLDYRITVTLEVKGPPGIPPVPGAQEIYQKAVQDTLEDTTLALAKSLQKQTDTVRGIV